MIPRRTFLHQVTAAGATLLSQSLTRAADVATQPSTFTADPKAVALHQSTGVFEAYTKPLLKFTADSIEPGDFVEHVEKMQAGLYRLREGSVRIANMSVGVPRIYRPTDAQGNNLGSTALCTVEQEARMVLRQLDALFKAAEQHPSELGIATTVAGAEKMNAAGKLALFLHLTGAWISNDLAVLRSYRRMGVVTIHPCIEGQGAIGDAANEVRTHGGLSPFGREVVKEMVRIGMMVDVAHGSDESIRQMIELSPQPVIYSHGGVRAISDVPRNLTDDRIRQIGANGGVIGIALVSGLLAADTRKKTGRGDPRYRNEIARGETELLHDTNDPYKYMARRTDGTFMPGVYKRLGWPQGGRDANPANRTDVEKVVDHMQYIAKMIGVDHVGLGTDYEAGDAPNGLEHAGKLANLTAALLRRGFSESDVRKILIDNFKRVYRKALDR